MPVIQHKVFQQAHHPSKLENSVEQRADDCQTEHSIRRAYSKTTAATAFLDTRTPTDGTAMNLRLGAMSFSLLATPLPPLHAADRASTAGHPLPLRAAWMPQGAGRSKPLNCNSEGLRLIKAKLLGQNENPNKPQEVIDRTTNRFASLPPDQV